MGVDTQGPAHRGVGGGPACLSASGARLSLGCYSSSSVVLKTLTARRFLAGSLLLRSFLPTCVNSSCPCWLGNPGPLWRAFFPQ